MQLLFEIRCEAPDIVGVKASFVFVKGDEETPSLDHCRVEGE